MEGWHAAGVKKTQMFSYSVLAERERKKNFVKQAYLKQNTCTMLLDQSQCLFFAFPQYMNFQK